MVEMRGKQGQIYGELMQASERGEPFEPIYERYKGSKGPLYNALSEALANLKLRIGRLAAEEEEAQEQIARTQSEHQALAEENRRMEAQAEGLERRIAELREREVEVQLRLETLGDDLGAKEALLDKAEDLEEAGLTGERLEALRGELGEIGAKRGLTAGEAVDAFFSDLESYDAKLGLELELRRLETLVETKQSEAARWRAEAESLEVTYRDRQAIVDEVERLRKGGVRGPRILAWGRILRATGWNPEEFEEELRRYGQVEKLAKARLKEIEGFEARLRDLKSQVETLESQKAEIEGSIRALAESGIREIEKVSEKAREEVQAWGETKVEAGKLEEELKAARYLIANDPEVLKAMPPEAVLMLLERARHWCELRGVNPKLMAGAGIHERNLLIPTYAEVELLDLLRWAYEGVLKAKVQA